MVWFCTLKVSNKCSSPCTPCNETRSWNCDYIKCNKFCHETCDRKPCDRPCLQKLVANFVYYEDRGHIIEKVFMENSIDKLLNEVKLPVCPKLDCKELIRRSFRYSSLIKHQLLFIEKVKIKTLATSTEIIQF